MIKSLLPGNAPGKELEGNQLKATISICVCWTRGYKVTALCFSPKFQTDLWRKIWADHRHIMHFLSQSLCAGRCTGEGLGHWAQTVLPASPQCQGLLSPLIFIFPVSFYQEIYMCVYIYIHLGCSPPHPANDVKHHHYDVTFTAFYKG